MTASRRPSVWQRVMLELLRAVLWPIARVRPASSWARLHARLQKLDSDGGSSGDPRPPRRRRESRTTAQWAVFALLISAAFAIWIYDVIRRPPPEPARVEHHCGH